MTEIVKETVQNKRISLSDLLYKFSATRWIEPMLMRRRNKKKSSKVRKVFKNGDWVVGIGEHEGCSQIFTGIYGDMQPFSYLDDYDPNNFRLATKLQRIQKYLVESGLDDLILNRNKYRENTPENAKHWIYVSDVILESSKILGSQNELQAISEIAEGKLRQIFKNNSDCYTRKSFGNFGDNFLTEFALSEEGFLKLLKKFSNFSK